MRASRMLPPYNADGGSPLVGRWPLLGPRKTLLRSDTLVALNVCTLMPRLPPDVLPAVPG